MTDSPKIYFVRGGRFPKMTEATLIREHKDCYLVRNAPWPKPAYNVYKVNLARSGFTATTDRQAAVTSLLVALQAAKEKTERRLRKITAAINEVVTKERM